MGKPSTRPGRKDRDIHEAIRTAALLLRCLPAGGVSDANAQPELAELMRAARAAIDASLPASFEFHGRRYYMRTRVLAQFDLFDSASSAAPLVSGIDADSREIGHVPRH